MTFCFIIPLKLMLNSVIKSKLTGLCVCGLRMNRCRDQILFLKYKDDINYCQQYCNIAFLRDAMIHVERGILLM